MGELKLGGGTGSGGSSRATPVGGAGRKILPMLLGLFIWPLFFFIFSGAPACMGFEDPTLRAIEACPAAAQALGTPVARGWLGWSCGNAETSDSFGQADWTFPVTGPNGSGSVSVAAEMRGGPWRLLRATLDVNGQTIDVLSCTGGGATVITPRAITASVAEVIGSPGVAVGDSCLIAIMPGAPSPFPCRTQITCGATTLYGGGSAGYSSCSSDAAGEVSVRDTTATPQDNDPTLDVRTADGEALLTDQVATGTWVVRLNFAAPGAPVAPPVVTPDG